MGLKRFMWFGDIRGRVGRYDPWGIKATGFAVTRKINHYAAVTLLMRPLGPNAICSKGYAFLALSKNWAFSCTCHPSTCRKMLSWYNLPLCMP